MDGYEVRPITKGPAWNSGLEQEIWQTAQVAELRHHMGQRPDHFPHVEARLLYDPAALYVWFQIDDAYVRAVAPEHQAAVYKDSCVEFFFTPSEDVSSGYFNLEMNCGGTMLFHIQRVPRQGQLIGADHVNAVDVAHTLPRIVEPELVGPVRWSVQYRLPFDILGHYHPAVVAPHSGVHWRANFYKCADACSHPHWLTWAPVNHPKPDFHRPDSFGLLVFA